MPKLLKGDTGDGLVCYYPTLDAMQFAMPGDLQRVLCVKDEDALVKHIATKAGQQRDSAVRTLLDNNRITARYFSCSGLRHDCGMKECTAGIYMGAAVCMQTPGSEEYQWIVTLKHPVVTEDNGPTNFGQRWQTQASQDLNALGIEISDAAGRNERTNNQNTLCK